MPGYNEQHLVQGLIVTMVDNSPYESLAGQPMPVTMRQTMEDSMARLAAPIHEHIVSWWNESGGGIFPDEKVKMTLDDPISGFLADKIDGTSIIYDEEELQLKIGELPIASNSVVGGVIVGSDESSGLYMKDNEIFARIQTNQNLSDSNSEMPSSKAVKDYVNSAIQNISSGGGIGDMLRSVYDVNNNGIIDNSERLGNELPSYYLDWGNLTNTPTTLSGYGITDVYTKSNLQTLSQSSIHWGNLTNTPTTLSGYGITDSLLTWSGTISPTEVMLWSSTGILSSSSGLKYANDTLTIENTINISDTNTVISVDASGNLFFVDAIAGTLTLDELKQGSNVESSYIFREVSQLSHGFDRDFIYFNGTTWTKAIATAGGTCATHFALSVDTDTFKLIPIGEIDGTGITDDLGNALVIGEFYFLSQTVPGKIVRTKPTNGIIQSLLIQNETGEISISIQEPYDINDVGGGTGVSSFIELSDVQSPYVANKFLKVNPNGDGIIYVDEPSTMVYPSAGIPISTGSAWGTSITNNSSNWDTAFSWGDHALVGYLTSFTEADPTVGSHIKSITTTDISQWGTAYSHSVLVTGNPHNVTFSQLSGSPSDIIIAGTNLSWDGNTLNASSGSSITIGSTGQIPYSNTGTPGTDFNYSGYFRYQDNMLLVGGNTNDGRVNIATDNWVPHLVLERTTSSTSKFTMQVFSNTLSFSQWGYSPNVYINSHGISVGSSGVSRNIQAYYGRAITDVTGDNIGGIGNGFLTENADNTIGAYANIDFRVYTTDGRIAYKNTTSGGEFHFITENSGTITDVVTIKPNGDIVSIGSIQGTFLTVTDGISTPSTDSGYVHIYVDSADGDLKIKFGDGTVKTIVTDS